MPREHGSPARAALERAAATAVFTCLPTSREVDELVERPLPALRPRARSGSIARAATRAEPAHRRAPRGARRGVPRRPGLGRDRRRAGRHAHGDGRRRSAALGRAREAIGAFAARVVHVGPTGAGHALKAINNTLLAVHMLAAAEGLFALSQRHPASPRLEVLNASSGRSHVTEKPPAGRW